LKLNVVDPKRRPDWDALMQAAVSGDAKSYEVLLGSFIGALRAVTRRGFARFGAEPNEIEDVVQETLLAIHLKRHTWKIGAPASPWIMAIARHKLIDALRRRGRRVHVPIETVMDALEVETSETQIDRQLDRQDAVRLLEQLKPRQAEIVRSISIDGYSIRDVARRLDMSEVAVRVALHRALKTMAMIYQEMAHGAVGHGVRLRAVRRSVRTGASGATIVAK
jgi:RNA polymerase sigma-70 factor, ECF subfamily